MLMPLVGPWTQSQYIQYFYKAIYKYCHVFIYSYCRNKGSYVTALWFIMTEQNIK